MATGVFRRRWDYAKRKISLLRRIIVAWPFGSTLTFADVTMTQSSFSSIAILQSKLTSVTLVR